MSDMAFFNIGNPCWPSAFGTVEEQHDVYTSIAFVTTPLVKPIVKRSEPVCVREEILGSFRRLENMRALMLMHRGMPNHLVLVIWCSTFGASLPVIWCQ